MPSDVVARIRAALDNNLDVPASLDVLHAIENDTTISPGAKFETFLYLDRILGLDLGRDLARQIPIPGSPGKARING
jgi:cysteinyl-tRNA synthetase